MNNKERGELLITIFDGVPDDVLFELRDVRMRAELMAAGEFDWSKADPLDRAVQDDPEFHKWVREGLMKGETVWMTSENGTWVREEDGFLPQTNHYYWVGKCPPTDPDGAPSFSGGAC